MKTTIHAAAGLAALCAASPASAQTRLLVNCFFPPQHFVCQQILPQWGETVEEATEGRVRINIPAQSMAPPPEQIGAVRSGVVDAAVQFNGFLANEVAGPMVAMQPFVTTGDAEANSVALWRTYEEYLAVADEFEGVELLGLFAAPGVDFWALSEPPITSMDELTGRRMWAAPGTAAETIMAEGGSVVSGPAVQMTEIIQRGVVDGFVGIPASDARAFNVLPYAASVTTTERKLTAPVFSFFISDATWGQISPEDQEAIRGVSGEAFARLAGGIWGGVETAAMETLAEDVEVVAADAAFEEALRTASAPLTEAWLARVGELGIDGQAALDSYTQQVDALAAE